ncbi:leishmanolysin-like peptidase [Trichonephila inaurata madagascariensis]|uniref:Leishmanolysin-like peptidase n=1 Tax=Trichonephila inaurata madagascariensis TaxID=2747483 RepID=A0A8X7CM60_9ARAC|nr:leishmanolysin-like peptidase [Trichonephila inaurata madagascariensis]
MSWFFPLYGSLIFIYIHWITAIVSYNCIHDEVTQPNVPVGEMTYQQMRDKRDKHGENFQPLNIHYYVDDVDPHMSENIMLNIDLALKKVVKFFHNTVAVRRSSKPFLIERANCAQKWQSGINKNKCSRLKSGPEFCSVKLTDFIIPDRYLNKLEIFDFNDVYPRQILESGSGINNANFFLFVISRTTSWCMENDVQAYGSYCRLDTYNRPVAGLLNMCPSYFSKKIYKAKHYYNVIMHEVIHILGFSLHLFPKFKTCTSIYDCETPKKIAHIDSNEIQRLVFPELVKSMQIHFNCSEEEFGGPLEKYVGDESVSKEMKYTSHWHPVLMYTSIMTPFIVEDEYTVIDNITLALLASTGWYHVNFTKADYFHLGRGEGCRFSFKTNCEDSKHLCSPGDKLQGCDILRQTIGKCESLAPYHPCGIFKPNEEEACFEDLNMHDKNCLMVKERNKVEPKCLLTKCESEQKMKFLVNDTWVECSTDKKVEANNVTLICPEENALCAKTKELVYLSYCSWDSDRAVAIRMYFTDQTYNNLLQSNNMKNFKVSTIHAIAKNLQVPVNYILNATLTVFKGAFLDFIICPPLFMSNDELGAFIKKAQQFLKSSTFTHIFKGATEFPIASTSIAIEPEVAVSFSDHEGFQMLTVIPVICGIFVIASFIASVFRLAMIQKHRPKRETVEMEDFSQISIENEKSKKASSKNL